MLAAAPKDPQSLELVKLVLTLISSGQTNIPESLKTQVSQIITQAKELTLRPSEVQGNILPESIDLALEMKVIEEFSEDMDTVSDIDSISPDLASKLLTTMESRSVYKD